MEEPPSTGVGGGSTTTSARPTAQQLKAYGKRAAARFVHRDLARAEPGQHLLDDLLHLILNPECSIDDSDNIKWCKVLIAGGLSPAEFAAIGELFG